MIRPATKRKRHTCPFYKGIRGAPPSVSHNLLWPVNHRDRIKVSSDRGGTGAGQSEPLPNLNNQKLSWPSGLLGDDAVSHFPELIARCYIIAILAT